MITRSLLLCAAVTAASGTLCYDTGSSEYIVQHGKGCGRGKDYTLGDEAGSYKGKKVVETDSTTLCQELCHMGEKCKGFEWEVYENGQPLVQPRCHFRKDTGTTVEEEHGTCFTKSLGGAYKFCAQEGGTCACNTEARFGKAGAWVHIPISGSDSVACTKEQFGVSGEAEGRECQCAAHDGLELLLDAATYVSGDEWLDESGKEHHGYLSFPYEKDEETSPTYVPGFRSPAHFAFDGKNDYIAIKDMHFDTTKHLSALSVSVLFRTDYSSSDNNGNWALLDFDRSEFFNLFVRAKDGAIGFSSHGDRRTHDMAGKAKVNDGAWHWVTVTYSMAQQQKSIYVDGVLDAVEGGVHETGIGSSKVRFGMMGEGSEASTQFGGSNGIYFHGDISRIEIYTSKLDPASLQKGVNSGVAIGDSVSCEAIPGDKCTWASDVAEDTYYFGHLDEEGDSVRHVAGMDATVVFPHVVLTDIPPQTRTFRAIVEDGCRNEDVLEAGWKADGVTADFEDCSLVLEGTADVATWQRMVRAVVFNTESEDFHERRVSWNFGDQIYSSETGHYYQFLHSKEITWDDARALCESTPLNGEPGYLVTVTSQLENNVVRTRLHGEGWIGLSDRETEGEWRWVTGPEGQEDGGKGRIMGYGKSDFKPHNGEYSNWAGGEPNDSASQEDYGHYMPGGVWNDYPAESQKIEGCVCEWGGMASNGTDPYHGTVNVHLEGCVVKPCNHAKKNYCVKEKGCTWSEGSAMCYPTCPENYFSELCNVYCHPDETCSGKGTCNNDGECVCDKKWGGPSCSWPRHFCKAWGDPHYTNFEGEKFDFHGVPSGSMVGDEGGRFVVYERGTYKIVAQHYRCSGTTTRPIGCMKQLRFVSGSWSMELNVDFGQTPREYGMIHVANLTTTFSLDTLEMKKAMKLPALIGNVALVEVRGSKNRVTYTFELPNENDVHTRVKLVQDNSWKAPYMNVYVEHFGSTHGVTGLCTGECDSTVTTTGWGKDCTGPFADTFDCKGDGCQFQTQIRDEDIKFCQGLPMGQGGCTVDNPGCENNMLALDWAQSCCAPYRTCGGEDQYKQCVVENCNMGWVGEEKFSVCTDAFEGVLLEDRECEREICTQADNRGSPECNECLGNYYGPDCESFCDRETTCNNHGTCNAQGKCWCEDGYTHSDSKRGVYCLHVCEAQATKNTCNRRSSSCRWSTAEAHCTKKCPKNYFGKNCEVMCEPKTTCWNHGSCNEEGQCVCKVGWGGEDCGKGKYTCNAWGDPHYTTWAGKRFDFFGPGYMVDDMQNTIDIQYEMYGKGSLHVTARHWKCNNKATCMKRLSVWDERGGTVEIRIDGSLRVNCTVYNKTEVAEKLKYGDWILLPRDCNGNATCEEVPPLRLTAAKPTNLGKGSAPSFFMEVSHVVPGVGPDTEAKTDVDLKLDVSARSSALDVYVTHFGDHPEKDGVSGLCHGRPGSGKPGTGTINCYTDDNSVCGGGVEPYNHCRTGPPPCAVTALPTCWEGVAEEDCGFCKEDLIPDPPATVWRCDDAAAMLQVEECCRGRKDCRDGDGSQDGGSAYEQCVWDECALGDNGKCLDNHGAAIAFDDQSMEESCACEDPHMAVNQETGECSGCKANWYPSNGKPCAKFCEAAVTCNGHGTCDGGGYCWCDEGYEGDECLGFTGVPTESKACVDQGDPTACAAAGSECTWDGEVLFCFRKTPEGAKECWMYFDEGGCNANGCFWDAEGGKEQGLEGVCLDGRPLKEPTPDCGDACPRWFTPVGGMVQRTGCPADECPLPREGEKVFVNMTGFPSSREFGAECTAAAEAMLEGVEGAGAPCQDGWALIIDSSTACDQFYDQMIDPATMPYPTRVYRSYYYNKTTRVSEPTAFWDDQDENLFGYQICYVPLRMADMDPKAFIPSTVAPRSCPGNFEFDGHGECGACEAGWHGVKCDVYCASETSCHGHGVCRTAPTGADLCTCSMGWEDLREEEEAGFEYALECYAATSTTKEMPGYQAYAPEGYTSKTAEIRPASGCGAEVEYATCVRPVLGDMVVLNVTGVTGSVASGCEGGGCKDGSATVVRKGAQCGRPAAEDVLLDGVAMLGTADPAVKLSAPVELPFNPMEEEYEVCYRPRVTPLPVDVKEHVDTKPAALARGAPDGGEESSDFPTAAVVAGVAAGVAAAAVAGLAYKKLSGGGGANGDFSQSKLDKLDPVGDDELQVLDEFDEYDREEP